MPFVNIVCPSQKVPFPEAVQLGIGKDQGLFMPQRLEPLPGLGGLLDMDFVSRSSEILSHLAGPGVDRETMRT